MIASTESPIKLKVPAIAPRRRLLRLLVVEASSLGVCLTGAMVVDVSAALFFSDCSLDVTFDCILIAWVCVVQMNRDKRATKRYIMEGFLINKLFNGA
jgi:hypothetical protein